MTNPQHIYTPLTYRYYVSPHYTLCTISIYVFLVVVGEEKFPSTLFGLWLGLRIKII